MEMLDEEVLGVYVYTIKDWGYVKLVLDAGLLSRQV